MDKNERERNLYASINISLEAIIYSVIELSHIKSKI